MKSQTIRDRYAALFTLSQRALPSASVEAKVEYLLGVFEKPYQATEKAKKKVIVELPTAEGEAATPPRIMEQRQIAMDEAMETDIPVRKIPDHMRLRKADMPKPLTGEGGWKNAEGNAQIKKLLGSLYVREGDELVLADKLPAGFEPDEAEEFATEPMAAHEAKQD